MHSHGGGPCGKRELCPLLRRSSRMLEACGADPCMCAVQVQSEVEAGISYLMRKRETDRYRHFLPRILYETASGGRQAPTFNLP